MKLTFDSARAAPRPETDLQDLLQSPLNDPGLVEDLQAGWRASGRIPTLAEFSVDNPLPRLTWLFDPAYYLKQNPDVAAAGLEPYVHFLRHGLSEGRSPHPLVDLALIQEQLDPTGPLTPDLLAKALRSESILPHRAFNTAYYLEQNPDVGAAGMPALQHFLAHGAQEGRSPHPGFKPQHGESGAPGAGWKALLDFAHGSGLPEGSGADIEAPTSIDDAVYAGAGDPPQRVEGAFDDVREHIAYGWVHAPDQPGRRLVVEIFDGSKVVGRGLAGQHRADLEKGGVGDGRHAFAIPLARTLNDGRRHRLSARVAGEEALMVGGEKVCSFERVDWGYDLFPDGRLAAHVPASASESPREFLRSAQDVNMLLATGQAEEALAQLSRLTDAYGDSPILALQTGEAYLSSGRADLSIEAFDRVLESGDGLAGWAWLGRANAQTMLGQWQEARRCYERANECEPNLDSVQQGLALVQRHEQLLEIRRMLAGGDFKGAMSTVGPLLLSRPDDAKIQSMALEAMQGRQKDGGSDVLDAETEAARRSIRLLALTLSALEAESSS